MATTSTGYNHARYLLATGALDLSTGTFKALLVSSLYTPDFDNHQFLSSITNELAGNGYSRQILGAVAVAKGVNKTTFKSSNIVFSATGGPLVARRCIIFKDTGTAGTSPLLAAVLMDSTPADVTITDGGTLTLTADATNGWLYIG